MTGPEGSRTSSDQSSLTADSAARGASTGTGRASGRQAAMLATLENTGRARRPSGASSATTPAAASLSTFCPCSPSPAVTSSARIGISRRERPSCATTLVRLAPPSTNAARTAVSAGSAEPSSPENPEDGGSALPFDSGAAPWSDAWSDAWRDAWA
ncbi:hypothetical protein D3C74_377180 [compost metagenome]